ncbi:HNH endonuclease [Erythrobacter sp. SDW2]|uniref:HNH endonuclease n=1 Tax=Erythrobacter sp. SDW2 TaxID=2907154 RepID=UPI001F28DC81|nr:HNH endonuclease signature motif containing protein [Erythrobacter sp. SDW2]UIP06005.1 HNH endonuclease [Erythrobacter sp. SDW2]
MSFVRNLRDLERNAYYLAEIIESDNDLSSDAALLIRKGRAFFPFQFQGKLAFCPSKFVGYRNNDLLKHLDIRGSRDGKDTNREINRIIGSGYVEDAALHVELEAYARRIGVTLENHKHRFWITESAKRAAANGQSAIDDLPDDNLGSERPARRKSSGTYFIRNENVRNAVRHRANGRCEYCGKRGFETEGRGRYVEAHHIISLSKQGPDTLKNVIALCPNHHREAHFGSNRIKLEREFQKILQGL